MKAKLQLRLLGRPEVTIDQVPVAESMSGKAQAILYYLTVTGQPHARSVLAGLLWGDMPETAARMNLRKALASLRQSAGAYLDIGRHSVAFKSQADYWVDVVEFEANVHTPNLQRLQEAVDLYHGDFLAGFYVRQAPDFEDWMLAEQARLRELVIHALYTLAGQHTGQGQLVPGIAAIRHLLSLEPWREEAHRQLMLLLAGNGQRSAALAQYETCRQVLAEALGVEPGPETIRLYERIREGDLDQVQQRAGEQPAGEFTTWPVASGPPPRQPRPARPRHNLPSQATPFIGRKQELAGLKRLLLDEPACRLLTLVGPGGIGKTRLALLAAQTLLDERPAVDGMADKPHRFGDGILFVPLAAVSRPSGIVSAIAEAANFQFYSNVPPRQQLLDYLAEKRILLVLDNFEHLLDATRQPDSAGLVSDILGAAPRVKILVTSRQGLDLQEAWFQPVAGLSFPGQDSALDLPLHEYDAVRLFEQSARRAQAGFSLAAEQAHVVRICQLVEGMPLAIELAATWLKVLTTARVVQEIKRSLDILTSRFHNVPERQRSIRVVMEQSWQLLAEEEQAVLKRLSVFQGSFSQEAAGQIASASLMNLARLVEKALVRVTTSGRYQLHELLRQFAAEKLAAISAEEAEIRTRHSAYFLDFLKARQQMLAGKAQPLALAEIGQEIDNIGAGWLWAVGQNKLERIGQSLKPLYGFYQIRSRYQEGADLLAGAATQLQAAATLDEALAKQPEYNRLLAMLAARQGEFCCLLGDFETASQLLRASLSAATEPAERAFSLNRLSTIAHSQGHRDVAENQLGQALAISREIGDLNGMAEALLGLAVVAGSFGEYAAGKELAAESVAISRQLGRPDRIAEALSSLAWCTNCLGAYAEAETYWQESLALCREIGYQSGIALGLNFMGWVAFCQGEARLTTAMAYYEEALAIYRAIGHSWNLAMCLGDMALAANELGAYEQAIHYGQEGLAITKRIGNLDLMAYNLYGLGAAASSRGDFQAGRRYLIEALKVAWETHIPDHTANVLFYVAGLLVQESELAGMAGAASSQKRVKAVELLSLVMQQPACWQVIKDRAGPLQARVEAMLPAEVAAKARAQGESQALQAVVTEVLGGEW